MPFIRTEIEGVIIFEPRVFQDDRGSFFESYNYELFSQNGIPNTFVQDNQSTSSYGTIRGLHFQKGASAQAKLVRVIQGKVLDVVVDLRHGSQTYGQHVAVELDSENNRQLFIPRGFAHGFSVLSETAIFAYKCDNFYEKSSEGGLINNDSELAIDWQISPQEALLSKKDLLLPTLSEIYDIDLF
jgi:dTDP-4-dehydrorhamnose 3,5-epimerase